MSSPTTVESFAGKGEEMAKILVFKSCKMVPQFIRRIKSRVRIYRLRGCYTSVAPVARVFWGQQKIFFDFCGATN